MIAMNYYFWDLPSPERLRNHRWGEATRATNIGSQLNRVRISETWGRRSLFLSETVLYMCKTARQLKRNIFDLPAISGMPFW